MAQHAGQLRIGKPIVDRVDDRAAEEGGVVELEVAMPVERHNGEPVAGVEPEAGAESVGQPQGSLGVLAEGRGVGGVVDRRPAAVSLGGSQEQPRIDELLHRARPSLDPVHTIFYKTAGRRS